eukprot:CAMPEP_0115481010 /NCGR_PEP_ID=MMETSP0271-20121206/57568_1 /TAXON_ID=71861 /ORGANISM="Scrippsiella trochoidea, Strain CCMP3099" /LENGTH=96 /DNA_ID=CAMNT_0002908713 /DNA_START=489 /DNA_END=779 /DNA_ORIENTATION=-
MEELNLSSSRATDHTPGRDDLAAAPKSDPPRHQQSAWDYGPCLVTSRMPDPCMLAQHHAQVCQACDNHHRHELGGLTRGHKYAPSGPDLARPSHTL